MDWDCLQSYISLYYNDVMRRSAFILLFFCLLFLTVLQSWQITNLVGNFFCSAAVFVRPVQAGADTEAVYDIQQPDSPDSDTGHAVFHFHVCGRLQQRNNRGRKKRLSGIL